MRGWDRLDALDPALDRKSYPSLHHPTAIAYGSLTSLKKGPEPLCLPCIQSTNHTAVSVSANRTNTSIKQATHRLARAQEPCAPAGQDDPCWTAIRQGAAG